ncbi:hypothetical protein [Marinomonas ostreistagni]|uniref:hypothetical protein n=1 Tax=Marinomonas ostreistagni TaxID=359209 RepID=UPI0019524525|nr:hypothetical protein [Marinomonas ostreistagni]MBM6549500.1 hypothetical protein [Marinomonas ostreistagni]
MKQAALGSVMCLLLGSAQATTTQTHTSNAAFLLEYSKGAELEQFGVGVGVHPEDARSGFGGLYYSEKILRQSSKTELQTLGFRGFSTEGGVDDPRGADITLGLSRTETDTGYKRSGFSARAMLYTPIMARTTWYIGADVRPTFLSFDWHNDVLSEVGFETGINVRLLDDLSLYGFYYHETRWLDDLSTDMFGAGVAAGVNWVW